MTRNNPYLGPFSLIIAAVALLAIAVVTGRGDITTATVVLAGTGCFIAGIFLLALHKGEPLDPDVAALLPVQGTIGTATLCADLGVQGTTGPLEPVSYADITAVFDGLCTQFGWAPGPDRGPHGEIIELRRDGYRRTPTDWTRVAGRDIDQQAESGHVYR